MKENFDLQIVEAIKAVKGCQFMTMRMVTEPKLNKAQKAMICGLGGSVEIVPIEKETAGEFVVNHSYENAVNNRAEKEQGHEVEFVAAPLKWGQWVEGQVNKLIENKGTLYLRFYGLKNAKVDTSYFVGGKPATEQQAELIRQFTEHEPSARQTAAGLTENQVVCRDVKIANILEMQLNGKHYTRPKQPDVVSV